MRIERRIAIGRDILCLTLGIAGIAHQEIIEHVQPALLAVYTVMLGIPGSIRLTTLLTGLLGQPPSPQATQPPDTD